MSSTILGQLREEIREFFFTYSGAPKPRKNLVMTKNLVKKIGDAL